MTSPADVPPQTHGDQGDAPRPPAGPAEAAIAASGDGWLRGFEESASSSLSELFTRAPVDAPIAVSVHSAETVPAPAAEPRRAWEASPASAPVRHPRLLAGLVAAPLVVVLVVAGAAVVATRVGALSDERADSAPSLADGGGSVADAERAAAIAYDRVDEAIAEAAAEADEVAAGLAAMHGYIDDGALLAARDATSELRAALAVLAPDPLASVDTSASAGGSEAVVLLQTRTAEAAAAAQRLTAVLADIDAERATYLGAVRELGSAFPAAAAVALAAAPSADAALRAAVTDAAASVVSAQSTGAAGVPEMRAYRLAVDALRAEQAQQDAQQAGPTTPEPRATQPRVTLPRVSRPVAPPTRQGGGSGTTPSTPAAPSTPPVTTPPPAQPDPSPSPAEPDPGPSTDPGPVDAGPTDPGPVDPEPTEPTPSDPGTGGEPVPDPTFAPTEP